MKVVFRADASLLIGTGHVMRCLTLADALAQRGSDCEFICREHEGNLIDYIRQRGFQVNALPVLDRNTCDTQSILSNQVHTNPRHSHWLGATQVQDAKACLSIFSAIQPDWLIVDHYALDARWEQVQASICRRVMVIDDLADRPHICDLLLDQTFGRDPSDYVALVPEYCQVVCGSKFALLRPEFAALRAYSLQRREIPRLKKLLITLGGVDKDNITGKVLTALLEIRLPLDCEITVIMGATAPWLSAVQQLAQKFYCPCQVLVGVSNMAQLMAESDLAIGAAGSTTWERCCVGLPTLMLTVADNQNYASRYLVENGAVKEIHPDIKLVWQLRNFFIEFNEKREIIKKIIEKSKKITDGKGCSRLVNIIMFLSNNHG